MLEIVKVVVLSLVEGLTEFLPVSSTGHLIIVNEFVKLEPKSFANMFEIIIQLGAILAVVVMYFDKLNPFDTKKDNKQKKSTIKIWKRVIIGALPAAILGLLFDKFIDEHLMNSKVVATMLLFWGIGIILLEKRNKKSTINSVANMSYATAGIIGVMQCLAMIPGTSRSAATIIGAMLLGLSRTAAAEFSFFLAIPTMLGATSLKIVKAIISGASITGFQIFLIILGMVLSFVFALIVIKKFMKYVQKNNFIVFGIYRIVLALVVFLYFLF